MSDPTSDDLPQPTRNRTDVILVELGRIGAAAEAAKESSQRTEGAVSSLALRVSKLEIDVATWTARMAERDAAEAVERTERGPRTSPAAWIALGLSALLALYTILDHVPGAAGG